MRDDAIRDHFRNQADACERLGSPFTGMVCRLSADMLERDTLVGDAVLGWPGDARDEALALRYCGALNVLVLTGAAPALAEAYPPHPPDADRLRTAIAATLLSHANFIVEALASPPQTNEVARSGMLFPGFLAVARATGLPLAIYEIGASAGLNLMFDRFHYRYGDTNWGDPVSPVQLAPELRGPVPPLDGRLVIASRTGSDIAPVDLGEADARLRLRSYVWPDQTLRRQRIDAAIELARTSGIVVEQADARSFVRRHLAAAQPSVTRTLFHSIMWQYMPSDTRSAIEIELNGIGAKARADAPLAWLRMEPLDTSASFATLLLTLWPGGETRHLARCDYHGRWIEWMGSAP